MCVWGGGGWGAALVYDFSFNSDKSAGNLRVYVLSRGLRINEIRPYILFCSVYVSLLLSLKKIYMKIRLCFHAITVDVDSIEIQVGVDIVVMPISRSAYWWKNLF